MSSYCSTIIFISVHILCAFSGRQTALLEDCNWINDQTLFTSGSVYAIDPLPYCNVYTSYASDTWEAESYVSFTYACVDGGVERNIYSSADCTGTPFSTATLDDPLTYNCDGTSECLMHIITYLDTADYSVDTECKPDWSKPTLDMYRVNGGCYQSGEIYILDDCSHCSVANSDDVTNPFGFLIETYTDAQCTESYSDSSLTISEGGCMYFGPLQVTECTGELTPEERGLDGIKECSVCTAEIDECLCDSLCSMFGGYFFNEPCMTTAAGLYSALYTPTYGLCESTDISIDCVENGLDPLWNCLYTNDCLQVQTPVCCDYLPCMMDETCVASHTAINFGADDVFEQIHLFCADGTNNCAVFKENLLCRSKCSDNDDDGVCFNSDALWECVFDAECYHAFIAVVGDIFANDGPCSEAFCSPNMIESDRETYCGDITNTCNALFDTVVDSWITCYREECEWKECEEEITQCQANTTCYNELVFVSNIEDNYHAAKDDDLMVIIKERFCSEQIDGTCSDLFETVWKCVAETNQCLYDIEDKCEESCKSEVDECALKDACVDTLLAGIANETVCRKDIQYGDYPLSECPECDSLSDIEPKDEYTTPTLAADGTCGVEDNEYASYENEHGEYVYLYDICKDACDACSAAFFDVGINSCNGDLGLDTECDAKLDAVATCISACSDAGGEGSCVSAGAGFTNRHVCSCQAECDTPGHGVITGGSYCNTIGFVAHKLKEDIGTDSLCEEGYQCCCSCQNCDPYIPFS